MVVARRSIMKTFKLIDLGRATKVTASSFIGVKAELVNPNLSYQG